MNFKRSILWSALLVVAAGWMAAEAYAQEEPGVPGLVESADRAPQSGTYAGSVMTTYPLGSAPPGQNAGATGGSPPTVLTHGSPDPRGQSQLDLAKLSRQGKGTNGFGKVGGGLRGGFGLLSGLARTGGLAGLGRFGGGGGGGSGNRGGAGSQMGGGGIRPGTDAGNGAVYPSSDPTAAGYRDLWWARHGRQPPSGQGSAGN